MIKHIFSCVPYTTAKGNGSISLMYTIAISINVR